MQGSHVGVEAQEQKEGRAEGGTSGTSGARASQVIFSMPYEALHGLCMDLAVLCFRKDCFGSWVANRLRGQE